MNTENDVRLGGASIAMWVFTSLCVFGFTIAILANVFENGLWLDEVIAVTHGNVPFRYFFSEVLRNDIHPFLYFLQLKLWNGVNPSDQWLLLNSVFWLVAACAMMWVYCRHMFGKLAGICSLAVFLCLPVTAHAASDLRMYTLIPFLILTFLWMERNLWIRGEAPAWRYWTALVCLCALVTSHALGFYFTTLLLLASFGQVFFARDKSQALAVHWPRVLGAIILVGLCALPFAGSALIRGSDAYGAVQASQLMPMLGSMITSWLWPGSSNMSIYAGFVWLFSLSCGLLRRDTRAFALIFLFGSIAIALAVSVLMKPMFKGPVFSAFSSPFIALFLGRFLASSFDARRWQTGAFVSALSFPFFAFISAHLFLLNHDENGFILAAEHLKRESASGDVIVAQDVAPFWGLLRYSVAPNWGSPLQTMPLKQNEQWQALLSKMGEPLANKLGLIPQSETVIHEGRTYVIGPNVQAYEAAAQRVWVFHYNRYGEPVRPSAAFGDAVLVFEAPGYTLWVHTRL